MLEKLRLTGLPSLFELMQLAIDGAVNGFTPIFQAAKDVIWDSSKKYGEVAELLELEKMAPDQRE